MPTIDFSNEISSFHKINKNLAMTLSYIKLLGTAYFPNNTNKRNNFIRYIYGSMEAKIDESNEINSLEFKNMFEIYFNTIGGRSGIFEAPNTESLVSDLTKIHKDSLLIGEIYLLFYALVKIHDDKDYATINKLINMMKEIKGYSRATIYKIWNVYKNVAHILAAINLYKIIESHFDVDDIIKSYVPQKSDNIPYEPSGSVHSIADFEKSSKYQNIIDTFIWSYEFQQFGLNYIIPNLGEPLLAQDEIWLVPEQVPWPPESLPCSLPKIHPDVLHALRGH